MPDSAATTNSADDTAISTATGRSPTGPPSPTPGKSPYAYEMAVPASAGDPATMPHSSRIGPKTNHTAAPPSASVSASAACAATKASPHKATSTQESTPPRHVRS